MKQLTSILIFAALAVTLVACSSSEPKQAAHAPEAVHDVALLTAERTSMPDFVDAVGTVRAAQSAQIASQVMGNVLAVNVSEGDHVRRGQLLAVIDDAQPRAGMERAQAALNAADHEAAAADSDYNLAQSTLKRYQSLFDKKSVSAQEFDEVKARAQSAAARRELAGAGQQQAKAALAQARTTLAYTRLLAPFEGVVTEKKVDPGALAAPGMPLLTVEASGRHRLEVSVDEGSLRNVRLNAEVPVTIDALGTTPLRGKVVQIVPAADAASRTFTVKIELPPDANLRSGLFGRAQFAKGTRETVAIPQTAIAERGQLRGVYVVGQDKIASLRVITLGRQSGDRVEVLSGLNGGETLIAAPGTRDLGGKQIEVR